MKTIYFVRHAKSSWKDPSLRDFDRPLNKRGFRDAPFMATLAKSKGARPGLIVSSPANRALTTATFFAKELGIEPDDIQQRPEIYEAFPDQVLAIVRSLPDEVGEVFVFGHNPTFTSLANQFTKDPIDNVPTCGIVRLVSTADEWQNLDTDNTRLTAFHYPKQYFD